MAGRTGDQHNFFLIFGARQRCGGGDNASRRGEFCIFMISRIGG